MERGPAPLDLSVELPDRVIGHACYHEKCVWVSRVRTLAWASARLGYRLLLSVPRLREAGAEIPSSRGPAVGRAVRAFLRRYVAARLSGLGHGEALARASPLLPPEVSGAIGYLGDAVERLYRERAAVVERHAHMIPPTGWAVLTDDTVCAEPFMLPPKYFPRVLSYAMSLPRRYTDLLFCDERRCYPTVAGVWPGRDWLVAVNEALRRDIVYRVVAEYGAATIQGYLETVDIEEVGVSVVPGRSRARVTVYVRVGRPEHHVVVVSRLQVLAKRVVREVEAMETSSLEEPVEDGYSLLGVSRDDVVRVVREVLGRRKKVL